MKWKTAMNACQCPLSTMIKSWLLKEPFQLKFIAECRWFLVVMWVLWITRPQNVKIVIWEELVCVIKNKVNYVWQHPTNVRWERLMISLRTITKSLNGKLLSNLVFHSNIWVILLMFFNTGGFMQNGFFACWRQRWKLQEWNFSNNCHATRATVRCFLSLYHVSQQNMGPSFWDRNEMSFHRKSSQHSLAGRNNQVLDNVEGYSNVFPLRWHHYQVRVLHWNTQNFWNND